MKLHAFTISAILVLSESPDGLTSRKRADGMRKQVMEPIAPVNSLWIVSCRARARSRRIAPGSRWNLTAMRGRRSQTMPPTQLVNALRTYIPAH